MPEVKVNYCENLPATDNSYKTRRFTVELTQDVADTADINGITERLFVVAKANVQAQVERARGDMALREMNGMNGKNHAPVAPQPSQPAGNSNGTPRLASQKQVKFLLELARKVGLSHDEIRALPAEFKKTTLVSLTSQEASQLIDRFNTKKAA